MAPEGTAATAPAHTKVTRQDWLDAAMETLIADGVEQVKILPLSRALGVSRSSFYWYFESREDLLDALLKYWNETNTAAILHRAARKTETVAGSVLAVFECFTDDALFNPRLDFAVREWARRSNDIRDTVDAADEERIAALADMFRRHGFADPESVIRAKILYYMQIGYYALDLGETIEHRLRSVAEYVHGFTGQRATQAEMDAFEAFARSRQAG